MNFNILTNGKFNSTCTLILSLLDGKVKLHQVVHCQIQLTIFKLTQTKD